MEQRINNMKDVIEEIQKSGVRLPDIRKRDWLKLDTPAAKVLEKLIEAEDYLTQLDDYQMEQGQNYPQIEDMMLQLGYLRRDYTKYIDEHTELLLLKEDEL